MRLDKVIRLLPLLLVAAGVMRMPSAQALPPNAPPSLIAEVSTVFDGETIRVLLHTGTVETVRYLGMDAPGPLPSDCFGPDASFYNRGLVLNRTVWLELDQQQRDSAGNLLAYVYLDPTGLTMVNAIMIAQGLARAASADPSAPKLRYAELFSSLQQEAQAANRGLWRACSSNPTPPPGNQPPQAIFTFSPDNPRAGQSVRFDASSSVDPDGRIVAYSWDFGDGASGNGSTVTHAYALDGVFTVTLTLTDDHSASGRTSRTIVVGEATAPPPPTLPPSSPNGKTVIIEVIHYRAPGGDSKDLNQQWVVLRANQQVTMEGWTIANELGDRGIASRVYHFPKGLALKAGQRVQLLSGCGTNSDATLYWCANVKIWDDQEGTGFLRDDKGQRIDQCHYSDPDVAKQGPREYNCETQAYK